MTAWQMAACLVGVVLIGALALVEIIGFLSMFRGDDE